MPNCPECGNDVQQAGLCNECASEKSTAKKNTSTGISKELLLGILIGIFTALVVVFVVVIISTGSPREARADTTANYTEDKNTKTENIQTADVIEDIDVVKNAEVKYDITKITEKPPIGTKDSFVGWMLQHTAEKKGYIEDRWELAQKFIDTKELDGENFVRAFLMTPREHFVRKKNLSRAYEDTWLSIGYGATITDPDVVSMMTTSLKIEPHHKVLEIGTGSGYQSAILSHLSNHVYSIEIIEELAAETDSLYKELEEDYPTYKNITRKLDDGFYGWEKYAPFDRIIVTCSIDHIPPPLSKQLSENGIMVVPLGPPQRQFIMQIEKIFTRNGEVRLIQKDVYGGVGVRFIPFRDKEGKSHSNG